jgi:hypothetical protein
VIVRDAYPTDNTRLSSPADYGPEGGTRILFEKLGSFMSRGDEPTEWSDFFIYSGDAKTSADVAKALDTYEGKTSYWTAGGGNCVDYQNAGLKPVGKSVDAKGSYGVSYPNKAISQHEKENFETK